MAETVHHVKTLEVCRVNPPESLPDSAAPKSAPLTFFDLPWIRCSPVQRLFFYRITSLTHQVFLDSIIPKLKHSLSLTLHHFPLLAANLTWPQHSHKPILTCADGHGVRLTTAESASDFHHLSGCDFRRATDFHPLLPHLEISEERAAVIALQVTLFPNCGISIGITFQHAVLDGTTLAKFTKLWAQTCKTGGAEESETQPLHLLPFYDRSGIKDPCGVEEAFLNSWPNQGGPSNRSLTLMESQVPPPGSVRGTFQLSLEKIEKLKKSVSAKLEQKLDGGVNHNHINISSFSVIYGYTCVCLGKVLQMKEREVLIVFPADCRSRLKPALPLTYFGNCIQICSAAVETRVLLGEDGVSFAAKAIAEAVKRLEDGVIDGGLEAWILIANAKQTGQQRPVFVGSSPRLQVYNTDFGWGRPIKTEVVSIEKTGAICLSDCRDNRGGIEIGLVLKLQEMENFATLFAQGVELL